MEASSAIRFTFKHFFIFSIPVPGKVDFNLSFDGGRGVEFIYLFWNYFYCLNIFRGFLRVWSLGHPYKLGNLAIFYHAKKIKKKTFSIVFTSKKRVDRIKYKGRNTPSKVGLRCNGAVHNGTGAP